ncbi:hypothetical protein [Kitasatospora viridis]|uniref:Uncharacterized protein n=1 Tax=Kitasatospora viridis TaxID=281105 RepID=A0A561SF28_9ACTN|nr:hypothetical protein [Kitasatospora viridis]TWF73484.1 hypothetical protein FHX73_1596 [Kitasatospora viridis]
MPSTEPRAPRAEDFEDTEGEYLVPGLDRAPGADPGEPETWEIVRVDCPECHRAIALVGDEEQLPQHAVLRQAWHPFSPALCPGSGVPTDELAQVLPDADEQAGPLAALLTLPAQLDWRTQPFSHADGPGGAKLAHRVPQMRQAPRAAVAHR